MLIALESANTDLAGAITYWRLTGDANGDDLNNALTAAGLQDHLLTLPSPRSALRRCMQEEARGPLFLRAGRGADGKLYLVHQQAAGASDDDPEFGVWLAARLSTVGQPQFSFSNAARAELLLANAGQNIEPVLTAKRKELTARFWHHIFHVATTDVSSWLIDQAWHCDAVSLRDSGGVYFIPRHRLDEWRQRVECLHAHTACRVYMIPSLHTDDAVGAIVQSLVEECQAFTAALDAEVTADELGARALEGRAAKAEQLLGKLARYEQLLGMSLEEVRTQVTEQQTNAIQAALMKGDA